MAATQTLTLPQARDKIARALSAYGVTRGEGELGTLTFGVQRAVTRTFRAHWTGFKLFYSKDTVVMKAVLNDGSFWSEGYISATQPSWILAFRKKPPPARGSGGPRPDDKLALEMAVEISLAQRKSMIDAGEVPDEELIRMEDFDDPMEAIDEFFNYTEWYALRSVEAGWDQLGYEPDPSMQWTEAEDQIASLAVDAAIQEALKKSDIIWITANTAPGQSVPCWFVPKDGNIYVVSGEPQQIVPGATRIRDARVVARWKGRDAQLVEFDAAVRPITASTDRERFEELAAMMLAKRQSVTGSVEENVRRWQRECVILEMTPRV